MENELCSVCGLWRESCLCECMAGEAAENADAILAADPEYVVWLDARDRDTLAHMMHERFEG